MTKLQDLFNFILVRYNLEEVRTLCFTLDLNYDDLGGEGISGKVRELILKLRRQLRLLDLVDAVAADHPHQYGVDWSQVRQSIADIQEAYGAAPTGVADLFAEERLIIPFQAPRLPPNFIGRSTLLSQIEERIIQAKEGLIIGLAGPPGVGKTTLAIYLAHQLRSAFGDGVLWAQMRTTSLEGALIRFAAAFGQAESVAKLPDVSVQAQRVHQILANKHLLLVLDNVHEVEQLQHLIPPGPHIVTLITTTNRKLLANVGATILKLEPFTEAESMAFLSQVIGEARVEVELAAARQLHRFVSGLPLALAIVAGYLAETPYLTIAEYNTLLKDVETRLKRLKDWSDKNRDVGVAFELSYQNLPVPSQMLFNSLSLFAGPDFDVEAVAEINRLSLADAKVDLSPLYSLSLIETGFGHREVPEALHRPKQSNQPRYRLISLLKDFAWQKLNTATESQAEELYERAAVYFSGLAQQNSQQDRYAHLDLEWQNIVGALNWAYEHRRWSTLITGVLGLTHNYLGTIGFMEARGYWHEARQLLAWAWEAIAESDDVLTKARILTNLGGFAVRQGDFEGAASHLQAALDLLEQPGETAELLMQRLYVYDFLAQLHLQTDLQKALSWLKRGIDEADKSTDALVKAHVGYLYTQLSAIYAQLGNATQALKAAETGLALLPDIPTPARLSGLINLGLAYHATGQLDTSAATFQQGIELAETLGNARHLAALWTNMALVERARGRPANAIAYQEKALAVYEWMGNLYYEAGIRMNVGANYLRLDQDETARYYFEYALGLARSHDLRDIEAMVLSNLAEQHLYQDQLDAATESLLRSRRICEELNLGYLLPTVVRKQAEVALARKLFADSLELLEHALALAKESEDLEEEGIIWRIKGATLQGLHKLDEAEMALKKSLDILTRDYPFDAAKSKVLLAQFWLDTQSSTKANEAQALMQQALDTFKESGALRETKWVMKLMGSEGSE